jgi:hypothetical protein
MDQPSEPHDPVANESMDKPMEESLPKQMESGEPPEIKEEDDVKSEPGDATGMKHLTKACLMPSGWD